tara:strand:+ start:358 stop:540 length:183 start_codon:yes stop_codon:yes gene_type:complete
LIYIFSLHVVKIIDIFLEMLKEREDSAYIFQTSQMEVDIDCIKAPDGRYPNPTPDGLENA